MTSMEYDLELEKVADRITKESAKIVCVQFPDGLKPRAQDIVDALQKRTGATIIIWAASCYGACDLPIDVERLGVDLLVQWGHSAWQ